MYRRYEPMQRQNGGQSSPEQKSSPSVQQNKNNISAPNKQISNRSTVHSGNNSKNNHARLTHPITKLIPESLYNSKTGKILGFLSAEDLLIAALILLLIDNSCDDDDNSLLIYALLYILISDHIDLPF